MMSVLCLSAFLVLATQGAYDYYNESEFSLYDSFDDPDPTGDKALWKSCGVRACYSTSGAGDSTVPNDFGTCDWSRSCIENQQDIGLTEGPPDLDRFEIRQACPALDQVPKKNRNMDLLWADDCDTCPQWECAAVNESKYVNRTWQEDFTLSFSSNLITAYCYECDCEKWTDSYKKSFLNKPTWAWTCDMRDLSTSYLKYDVWECDAPTSAPTTSPTMEPTFTSTTGFSTTDTPYCKDNSTSYSVGQAYFSLEESSCETYCLCEEGGNPHCQKGWSNIMEDSKLYPYFVDKCKDYITSCYDADDAGDLYKYYDPDDICNIGDISGADEQCPRCKCSEKDAMSWTNTSTFNSYQFDWNLTGSLKINCSECECVWGGSYNNQTHIDPNCPSWDIVWEDDYPDECEYSEKKCFSDSGYYDADAGTTSCGYDDYQRECAFSQALITTSPEDVCIETDNAEMGEWGCADSLMCEGYGGIGCYYSSFKYKVKEYDCINNDWLEDTYEMDAFYSCCHDGGNFDKCNNRTTDSYLDGKKDCEKSSELEDYMKFTSQCYYSTRNVEEITKNDDFIRAAFCGDSLDYEMYVEDAEDYEDVCELIQVIWQYNTFCDCNEKRIMRANLAGQEDEPYDIEDMLAKLQSDWDSTYWATTGASRLNDWWSYFGCNEFLDDGEVYNFTCNVSVEAEAIADSDGANNKVFSWFTVGFVTLFCGFFTLNYRDLMKVAAVVTVFAMIASANAEADSYNWEQTNMGDVGACEFMGSQESESEVCDYLEEERLVYQDNTLTWRALIDACPDLEQQGCWTDDDQIDLEDLVWDREDCNSCPHCPCNNATDTMKYYKLMDVDMTDATTSMVTASCYECGCYYWENAKDYAWNCSFDYAVNGYYAADEDYKCMTTDYPTSAPTNPVDLWCVVGNDHLNNTVGEHFWIEDNANTSCYWNKIELGEIEADPEVCLNDKFYYFGDAEWGVDDSQLCNSLGSGCWYADWDLEVEQYDCVLGKYVKDKYPVVAQRMCCDNGPYCNNNSITMDGPVMYEDYSNETYELQCKSSNILKEYWEIEWACDHGPVTDDEDFLRNMQCGDDYRYYKGEMCDNLDLIWKYNTDCDCNRWAFWEKYVNDSIDLDYNNATWYSLKLNLATWSSYYDCGKDDYWDWSCDGGMQVHGLVAVFIAIGSLSFFD